MSLTDLLPLDVAEVVVAYLDFAADGDVLETFARNYRERVTRAWLRASCVTHERTRLGKTSVFCQLVNGKPHSIRDQPAIVRETLDGFVEMREWRRNGVRHRGRDKPAVIHADGTREWYKFGLRHRDRDRPAVIYANGRREWYKSGEAHRDDDQPAVTHPNGTLEWYRNGVRHRDDGQPAVVTPSGRREWWRYGRRKRVDYQTWLALKC